MNCASKQTPHHYTFLYTNFFLPLSCRSKKKAKRRFRQLLELSLRQYLAAAAKGGRGGLLRGDSHWTRKRERQRDEKKGMDFFGWEIKGSRLAGKDAPDVFLGSEAEIFRSS